MAFVPDHLPIRILCVEDDDAHFALIESYLLRLPFEAELLLAQTRADAEIALRSEPVDIVLVDYHLPDGNGLDLVEALARDGGPPFVVLSGVGSERVAVGAMKRGAADYLRKDAALAEELPRAVTEALERRSQRISKRRETRELEHLAFTDPLTGLRNRRYFEDAFERELASSLRYGHPLSLLVVDFDHFKSMNDTWGHQFGDRVLAQAALRMTEIARSSDLLARYGGEAFVVLLPCTPLVGAEILADRIVRGVQQIRFEIRGEEIRVTMSGGLATFSGGSTYDTTQKLFAAADAALYRAKNEGRNRLIVAPSDGGLAPPRRPSRPLTPIPA